MFCGSLFHRATPPGVLETATFELSQEERSRFFQFLNLVEQPQGHSAHPGQQANPYTHYLSPLGNVSPQMHTPPATIHPLFRRLQMPQRIALASSVQWNRAPIRRKQCRRGKRITHSSPMNDVITLYLVLGFTFVYYTQPDRSYFHIIFMDALILTTVGRLLQSGIDLVLQATRNKSLHSLLGDQHPKELPSNTSSSNNIPQVLPLADLVPPQIPQSPTAASPNAVLHPIAQVLRPDQLRYAPTFLLQMRPPTNQPPVISLAPRPKPCRTGRRRKFRNSSGTAFFSQKRPRRSQRAPSRSTPLTHRIQEFDTRIHTAPLSKPSPPQRGMPGVSLLTNEECNPTEVLPLSSLLGQGCRARLLRRRYYRQWRRLAGENISLGRPGNDLVRRTSPQKAVKQIKQTGLSTAKAFKLLILQQRTSRQPPPTTTPRATPPLQYGTKVRLGTQNVQALGELLKHQAVLDLMQRRSLDILILTETRNTSYHSFMSQGYWFVHNGNKQDKYGGVTAVISPRIKPFIQDILQHTSRHIELLLKQAAGLTHIHGIYAPHDKSDADKKFAFWDKLETIVSATPQPEPYYVIGDFNVRLQGRAPSEHQHLGPHILGKGPSYIRQASDSNRFLYLRLLQLTDSTDALTFKQPNLHKHITYKDKHPPPACWSQFLQDPLRLLQIWDKFQTLPSQGPMTNIELASHVRGYLTDHPLLDPPETAITADPQRFQNLDKLVVPAKWLPSIQRIQAIHTTGFPSDHYLLDTEIRIKLSAKTPKPTRPLRHQYKNLPKECLENFHRSVKAELSPDPQPEIPPPLPQQWHIYTDGSGSKGTATATTPAGWGFVAYRPHHTEYYAKGPVDTDSRSAFHLGATVSSNNTAKLTALMEAQLWMLSLPALPTNVTFHYDSK